jgi:hypothetical protein
MNLDIFVEGQFIDPPEDFSAQFTYNIDDVRDYAARNTAFSKSLALPMTGRNKAIFGHIWQMGSGNYLQTTPNVYYNFDPSKKANCVVLLDSIQIFKGVIRIMDIVIDEEGSAGAFEVSIFGELGGLIAQLGDKKIETLDFSDYDHNFTAGNITSSWGTAIGSGFYYGLVDYGYSLDKVNFPIENFRPMLYLKEYLDKIFLEAGYTYQSDFLTSVFFKKLLIPFNSQYPTKEFSTVLELTDATYTWTSPYPASGMAFDTWVTPHVIFTTTDNIRWHWSRAETVKLRLRLSFNWSTSGITGTPHLYFKIRTGTGTTYDTDPIIIHEEAVAPGSGSYSFDTVIEIKPNSWFEFCPGFVEGPVLGGSLIITNTDFKLEGQPTVQVPLANGDHIEMSTVIPKDILRLDLLKWVIKMFNLMIWEDKDVVGKLHIEPWVDFYDTVNPPLDWTSKLDRSKPYRLKPMGELNSRIFDYKYKDDNDYYNDFYKKTWGETYGSYLFDTGLDYVKDKQTVDIGFSPSPLVGYPGSERVMPAIYKRDDNGVLSRTSHNIRIFMRKALTTTCQPWFIYDSTAPDATLIASPSEYPYVGHLDDPDAPTIDINFGAPLELYFALVAGSLQNNLFNAFWSFYIAEITDKDSKLLTGTFRLGPVDINSLDFSKIIFIDGSLWRLNKVEDYSTDQPETVKVELLKVIDLV